MNQIEKAPLSVVIIAKNEERNIEDCLKSVLWAREIVLVDDDSSDRTIELAKPYATKIIRRKMDVEGRHRNFAYAQADQEWVLSLDADERVSPELRAEIETVLSRTEAHISGYAIPIKTYIGKRWIKAAGYYPARKLRLHRKGKFRYEESGVHPRAFMEGKEKPLKGDIIHFGYRNFSHFVRKMDSQTNLEAQKWLQDGRRVTFRRTMYKMTDRFFRYYIGKKGYTDGFMGFFMSVCHSLYQLLTYAKYWEHKNGIK